MQTRLEAATGVLQFILDNSSFSARSGGRARLGQRRRPDAFTHLIRFAINDVAMVFFFALARRRSSRRYCRAARSRSRQKRPSRFLPQSAAWPFQPQSTCSPPPPCAPRSHARMGDPLRHRHRVFVPRRAAHLPPGHPAIPFLLLLAIADDAFGLVLLALFYPRGTSVSGGLRVVSRPPSWVPGSAAGQGSRVFGRTCSGPGLCRGLRSTWAASIRPWRSCRSCRCRTKSDLKMFGSGPRPTRDDSAVRAVVANARSGHADDVRAGQRGRAIQQRRRGDGGVAVSLVVGKPIGVTMATVSGNRSVWTAGGARLSVARRDRV